MPTWAWILIIVAAAVIVLLVIWSAVRARRTRTLQGSFGREYDRTVEHEGGRREAERELLERQKRHDALDIRPLPPAARDRYAQQWQETQTRFVDDPAGAVADADRLVQRVMKERGYPTDDFERRASDISVEHPDLVERYRTAHGIAQASEQGRASTEDLRQSVRHYRSLFEVLLVAHGSDDVEDVDDVSSRDEDAGEARRRDVEHASRDR
jgi:hypothetical protein